MNDLPEILPFGNCPALDGYHCITNSLAKIYHFYGHPLSEDMLLGLGAGMGFIYWKMQMGDDTSVFIGGRGNTKAFYQDLGNRTGVNIKECNTKSVKKAESRMLEFLRKKEPVMMMGDMGLVPWFNFPGEYHFGGHSFVICGYDGNNMVLASDMEQAASGLKKGFYHPARLDELAMARNSTFKPFPPGNAWYEFDFTNFHKPGKDEIFRSIQQTADAMLNPPIRNLGTSGIKMASKEILKWPGLFSEKSLRMNLFMLYIYLEIGGTGGGCFRYMYSRFLKEVSLMLNNPALLDFSASFQQSGEYFSAIGNLFRDAEQLKNISPQIKEASELFLKIADLEEEAFSKLTQHVK